MAGIVTIKGTEEVMRALEKLGGKLSGSAARKAVTKAARLVAADAKAKAPKATGALRASIGVRVKQIGGTAQGKGKRGKTGGAYFAAVGPRRKFEKKGEKPSKYAHLVHQGHHIKPHKSKKGLVQDAKDAMAAGAAGSFDQSGGFVVGRPFILDAYRATKNAAVQIMISEIAGAAK